MQLKKMKKIASHALKALIDLDCYCLDDPEHITDVKRRLDRDGMVTLPDFLRPGACDTLIQEATLRADSAFFTTSTHNVYLTPSDQSHPAEHVVNRQINSSKGASQPIKSPRIRACRHCITTRSFKPSLRLFWAKKLFILTPTHSRRSTCTTPTKDKNWAGILTIPRLPSPYFYRHLRVAVYLNIYLIYGIRPQER